MKIFIERPIATAMAFLALTVLGVYSFLNIPIEMPVTKEQFPEVSINTTWAAMPPEIIQTELTSPLEEKVSTVKGVRKIESSSRIGNSRITLEFDPKINMEFAQLALREKIAELKDELPYGLRPQITPYIPEDFSEEPFLRYTISGDYSLQKLREMVKDRLENTIGAVKGVSGVDIWGGSDPEIKIMLIEDKIKALNIQPYLVSSRIQERTRIYPAGTAKKGEQELLFKVSNPIKSLREMGEIVVTKSGENAIRLKEIAVLVPSYGDILHIHRINGQPTISMNVHKEKGLSTLRVSRDVKHRLEEVKKELPPDLIFRAVNDESEGIQKHLKELYILVGIIIAVIFILIYLVLRSMKPSLLVLSSIGFSVLLTFNLVYFTKTSLNMLTLGGLALGFGLFVDNSIVVFENVLRIREGGTSPVQAAIQGSREVFLPVFASTLTTMSVFFSIAYFQGRLKLIYLPMAIVISSALAASLLVSFSVIPALSPRILKSPKKKRKERYRDLYAKALKFLIKHPVEILLIVAAIFFGSYKWFRSEVTLGEFFSWYSKEKLRVYVGMPAGTDIERTDVVMRQFEEKVIEKDYEKELNTSVMSERGFMEVSFPTEIEMSYRPYLLKEELIQLATNFAGINVSISGFDPQGYYSGFGGGPMYDSRIKFFGYNLKKLRDITSSLERTLKRNPRIKDVKIISSRGWWFRGESFEYVAKLDKEALRKYDIDPLYLYYQIAAMLSGRVTRPIKVNIGGKELEFSIKFPDAEEMDIKEIQDVLILTRKGEYLRLGEVSSLEEKPIAGSIDREDQQFQQTVMWEFRGPTRAAGRYREGVFARLDLPPGFSATMEDTWFLTEEEKGQIKFAILFSLVVIFMILASLYESIIQPFFILFAVPLALIGVFVAFVIANFAFDSSAYIGVILLGGIVVNNSILLVDHINLKRRQDLPLLDAVIQGARERIRPIFMTTGTTVLGMLPLVLIQVEAGRRQIWASLALSAVGGLISSTIFILITIPIFYYYGDGLRTFTARKIAEFKKAWKAY
ncbi:MAG: efflux RND transporter permease subunit [Candidatus Aminicenantes bacterium]|jgi:HAE1 family hydrophobic/amphiphilic exporter-1